MDAAYFDDWYANMSADGRQAQIQREALGLPAHLDSSSLLPWSGIDDVAGALTVGDGDTLVDLGCGRGGYGIEVSRRTGAALIGVDWSAVAVEKARVSDPAAQFSVGDLTASGLPDACAAGLMCIDAMQFADPYQAGLAECLRILAPGGRLALTGWQPATPGDEALPARLRVDIGSALRSGGFADVASRDMAEWLRAERAMWEAASATEPDGDPALDSMRAEGIRVLTWTDRTRRVLVTARRP